MIALPIRSVYLFSRIFDTTAIDTSLSISKERNGQSIIPAAIGINSLAATADNILGNSSSDLLKIRIRHWYTFYIDHTI